MATAPAPQSSEGAQADVVAYLGSGHAFGGAKPIEIGTHAARIFLAGDRAWKIKRAVRYPYLDFSTLQRRCAALQSECVLNRRTAPDMYLGVWPIRQDAAGRLSIAGAGETVEWVLEMRRFPDGALLSEIADRQALDEPLLARLASRIVDFHAAAVPIETDDGAARLGRVIEGNRESARRYPHILSRDAVEALVVRQRKQLARLGTLLDARARSGRVRHCHADLHLANVALIEGEPTLFDCLEFDDELARIDILYDLAFLLMDLWQRNARKEAGIVFNRYFDRSPEDEAGNALMPLFMSVRAAIRAHVCAASARGSSDAKALAAKSYLELASRLLVPEAPCLIAIGGLSGTGKSTLARHIAGEIGAAPGARVIRTDVIRKRLAGVPIESRLPKETYTPAAARHVYTEALRRASETLESGRSVIMDAVFAEIEERDRATALAARFDRPFTGMWLEASQACRRARVAGRLPDASDADVAVAEAQKPVAAADLTEWYRIDAESGFPDIVSRAKAILLSGADPGRVRQD